MYTNICVKTRLDHIIGSILATETRAYIYRQICYAEQKYPAAGGKSTKAKLEAPV